MNRTVQKISVVAIMLFASVTLNAQNVGINTTGAAPDGGSLLDISSANKGLLIPRVNIANLTTIAPITGSATTSMLVYNTNATTGLGYYYWDGGDWVRFTTGSPLVDNGLYYNTGANRVRLGGSLVENTTITQGARQMTFNLNGTGDFNIQDNGTTRFSVQDNGRVTVGGIGNTQAFNVTGQSYFSDDLYLRDGSVTGGDILVRIFDSGDDGIIDIYENNARNIRLHGNGVSVFNEQGIASNDFRIESDNQANMFFVDAGTNEIGIRTATPTSMLQMTNAGVNVGANAMASFDNAGTSGVSVSGYNTSTTNGYNAIEGIVNYSGTAFNSAGVFGLAINNALTNSAIGVRGTINGRDGFGVLGTRTNGAGAGWAGLFIEDLGYTGFFGAASDERLKKNIEPIKKALDIVKQLNPVTYDFDLEKNPGMGLNTEMEYGFLAQEVKEILPEIVREKNLPTNSNREVKDHEAQNLKLEKFMVMDYTRIIPILTKAIQEQQALIEKQNQKLEELGRIVKELQENK